MLQLLIMKKVTGAVSSSKVLKQMRFSTAALFWLIYVVFIFTTTSEEDFQCKKKKMCLVYVALIRIL